jgi:hypothetical protein
LQEVVSDKLPQRLRSVKTAVRAYLCVFFGRHVFRAIGGLQRQHCEGRIVVL